MAPKPIPHSEVSRPSKARMDDQRSYEAQDALRTLHRAEQIRGNKALMADVTRMHGQHAKAIGGEPATPAKPIKAPKVKTQIRAPSVKAKR